MRETGTEDNVIIFLARASADEKTVKFSFDGFFIEDLARDENIIE